MFGFFCTTLGIVLLATTGITAQATQGRNLLVVSRHEPAKGGNLVPKSQQTLVVSPQSSDKSSKNVVDRLTFPAQLVNSFLPRGFLSNPNVANDLTPTVQSPVATTSSGSSFDGITESINNFVANINQRANLLTKSIEKDITRKTSALTGLIKASAEKRINAILSSALGGLTGDKKVNTKAVENINKNNNGRTTNTQQRNVNSNSRRRGTPLVLRNRPGATRFLTSRQSTRSTSRTKPSPRQQSSATGPLVLSRQQVASSRPLVLAPQPRITTRQRNTETRTRTRPAVATTVSRVRSPAVLNPSRLRPTLQRNGPTRRQPTPSRPRVQTTGPRTTAIRTQTGTRPQATRTPTRQRSASQQSASRSRSRRCPSQDDCKLVVPASCRRQTYITDDNGRRICRRCDEDRCAFGGFEQRWERGFG